MLLDRHNGRILPTPVVRRGEAPPTEAPYRSPAAPWLPCPVVVEARGDKASVPHVDGRGRVNSGSSLGRGAPGQRSRLFLAPSGDREQAERERVTRCSPPPAGQHTPIRGDPHAARLHSAVGRPWAANRVVSDGSGLLRPGAIRLWEAVDRRRRVPRSPGCDPTRRSSVPPPRRRPRPVRHRSSDRQPGRPGSRRRRRSVEPRRVRHLGAQRKMRLRRIDAGWRELASAQVACRRGPPEQNHPHSTPHPVKSGWGFVIPTARRVDRW